jgi:hypothetical protein
MLSGVVGGKYLQVHGGDTGAYINKNYGGDQFMTGDMRYDMESQVIKVFDGKNWQSLYGGTATINLTNEAQQLFEWAKDKRDQEQQLLELAKAHPALQDALEALQRAEDQVKIVAALVQE